MLKAGDSLSRYEILGFLDQGGMGEVYRARDRRLRREVALKILPDEFVRDADRIVRLRREAQALASLNHPNVAAVHSLEEDGGRLFIVMELIHGESLRKKLARGPLPLAEGLGIAIKIARGLEAAHEHGIIHRDIKPANILVTDKGTVKILDFGLAKRRAAVAGEGNSGTSTTMPAAPPTPGPVVVGTPAYMSPEQVRGEAVDTRADIWAFGCVLFEVLTGRNPFAGKTASDVLVRILEKEPRWEDFPGPPRVGQLLKRCLQKDPDRRVHHIADARIELEEALEQVLEPAGSAPPRRSPRRRFLIAGALASAASVVLLGWLLLPRPLAFPRGPHPTSEGPLQFTIGDAPIPWTADPSASLPSVAISRDGRLVVYRETRGDRGPLRLRDLAEVRSRPIPGTDGATAPFFSPDGRRIGFFRDRQLCVASLAGGGRRIIAYAPVARGAAWAADDSIVYSPYTEAGLWRVRAAGGEPEPLLQPDPEKGERTFRWPTLLPDGSAVLFTIGDSEIESFDNARIAVFSLRTRKIRPLVENGTYPRYLTTGHLLYVRDGALFAAPFDAGRLVLAGPPVAVFDGVVSHGTSGAAHFDVSESGTLVYAPGGAFDQAREVFWVDRNGGTEVLTVPTKLYEGMNLSPDGRRIALDTGTANAIIWIFDLERETLTRLTSRWNNNRPVWSPNGERIAFSSGEGSPGNLALMQADGSGGIVRLTRSPRAQFPESWSPDGTLLVYSEIHPETADDLWILPLEGPDGPRPFLRTRFREWNSQVSPDGRWIAYISDESGRWEVYVQPFPGGGTKWQISSEGGVWPRWSAAGHELFYLQGDSRLITVPYSTAGAQFRPSRPGLVADLGSRHVAGYDVSPDGSRFLVSCDRPPPDPAYLRLILGWSTEVQRVLSERGKGSGPGAP